MNIPRLPRPKSDQSQLEFLPDRIKLTPGYCRYLCGDTFEAVTSQVTGAVRHCTDSRIAYCPDLIYQAHTIFEVKAVGRTGQAIVYDHRLFKDLAFNYSTGMPIYYWLWSHNYATNDASTVDELRSGVLMAVKHVTIVDLPTLAAWCLAHPVKVLNPKAFIQSGSNAGNRLGYGDRKYGRGWTVPIREIDELCQHRYMAGVKLAGWWDANILVRQSVEQDFWQHA